MKFRIVKNHENRFSLYKKFLFFFYEMDYSRSSPRGFRTIEEAEKFIMEYSSKKIKPKKEIVKEIEVDKQQMTEWKLKGLI